MKRNVYGALMIVALALLVSVPMTQAQAMKANVPFEFSLNQQFMPAGNYEISSEGEKLLAVRHLDTMKTCMLIESIHMQASQAPHAKLVFHKYGDQYFLSEIWDGSDLGIQIPESKREKEMKWARNDSGPELVVIAMK
ncbi:MAG: hypothetical protein ACLPND_17390 [Candidatus Korobacteraceae bacterium]|jgi:hypothetical protein